MHGKVHIYRTNGLQQKFRINVDACWLTEPKIFRRLPSIVQISLVVFKMGCCCSKKHLTKKKAFPQELGTPLLDTLVPQLGKNARVVVASLTSLKHVESPEGLPANAFIRIRLAAADEVGGVQEQSSSINPGTHNPRWVSTKRFMHVLWRITCRTFISYISTTGAFRKVSVYCVGHEEGQAAAFSVSVHT